MARAATTTDVFNAIAEAKRREMIGLLNNGKYWTVSEIVGRMKITQPTASKHLRVLRKVGIVTVVKHGRYRQYRLNAQSLHPCPAAEHSRISNCTRLCYGRSERD